MLMRWLVGLMLIVATPAVAKLPVPPPVTVAPFPGEATARPVHFGGIQFSVPAGDPIGTLKAGVQCGVRMRPAWPIGSGSLIPERFARLFKAEMERLGLDVVSGDPGAVGSRSGSSAEYLVTAEIRMVKVDACYPFGGFGVQRWNGAAQLSVKWHVRSLATDRLASSFMTYGGFDQDKLSSADISAVYEGAFAENVRLLAADRGFRSLLPKAADESTRQGVEVASVAEGEAAASLRAAEDATVRIVAEAGSAVGALISADGSILVNTRALGGASRVKVRWSDGVETAGAVVRTDPAHDIALVKTGARPVAPIALRRSVVVPNENSWQTAAATTPGPSSGMTIGTILGATTVDGRTYLQRETAGSADMDGVLLDDSFNLIGIPATAAVGAQLFVPVAEVIDTLAIDLVSR